MQLICYPIFDGLGGVERLVVPLGITASTITPIITPMTIKTLTFVMPCSLNNVLNLSQRVVSSFKTLFIVSFILFICPHKASLFALAASSLTSLSSSRFFKRALISFLLISSFASPCSSSSFAMTLSMSVRFAKLFTSSTRIRCNA